MSSSSAANFDVSLPSTEERTICTTLRALVRCDDRNSRQFCALVQSLEEKTGPLTSAGIADIGKAEIGSTLERNFKRADKLCLIELDSFSSNCMLGLASALRKNRYMHEGLQMGCGRKTHQKLGSLQIERGLLM